MATSNLKIVARNIFPGPVYGKKYLISTGDPRTDTHVPCFAADTRVGTLFVPAMPFDVYSKYGDWELIPNDPTLLQTLMAFPRTDTTAEANTAD